MATLKELQQHAQSLIRKGLQGSLFVAPSSVDDEITALWDTDGLIPPPTGYVDVGLITKEQGLTWSRDVSTEDVESLGYAEPTRRDIISDVTGLQVTMQETKAQTLELYEGVDLSAVVAAQAGDMSNISFDKPDLPASIYYRAFALFRDGHGADAFYFAKWLPRVQVTDRSEQAWLPGTEVQYGVTFSAFVDENFGTACRTLMAVPTSRIEAMGFEGDDGGA